MRLQNNSILSNSKSAPKAVNLRPPFIKIEDTSLNYRPIFYEMQSTPLLLTDRYMKTSPFYYPHRTDGPTHAAASAKHSDVPLPVPNFVGFLHSSGYCEICEKEFNHINAHIKTKTHVCHALNDHVYAEIDDVIKLGFMNERITSMPRSTMQVPLVNGVLKTFIPVSKVKFTLTEDFELTTTHIFIAGIYHHMQVNQSIILHCTRTRSVSIEPMCIDYLNKITTDSAVHPQILSMSKIPIEIPSLKIQTNICVIESSCMFITKNKKLPGDCTNLVKMDLFLLPLPAYDTDILFSLLTHPQGLYKSNDRNNPNNTAAAAASADAAADNAFSDDAEANSVLPWCINDIIQAITQIQTWS